MTSKLKIVRWMIYLTSCLVFDINEATMLLKNEPTTILLLFPFVPSKKNWGVDRNSTERCSWFIGMRIMMKHKAKHEHSCCLIGRSQCNSQTFKRHQLNPTPNPKLSTCSANTARQWDFFSRSPAVMPSTWKKHCQAGKFRSREPHTDNRRKANCWITVSYVLNCQLLALWCPICFDYSDEVLLKKNNKTTTIAYIVHQITRIHRCSTSTSLQHANCSLVWTSTIWEKYIN